MFYLIIIACITACLALWIIPIRQTHKFAALLPKEQLPSMENEFRKTLAQIVGSIIVIIGLLFTWNQIGASLDANRMNETRLRSERFAKAVEHIGSTALEIRIGGMFSLQQLAEASNQDCWMAQQILSSFVRNKAKKSTAVSTQLAEDVHCALKVLGKINNIRDIDAGSNDKILLNDISLIGASLVESDFRLTDFQMSNLLQTDLRNAHLEQSNFAGADLTGSNLSLAKLQKADLHGLTSAESARFIGANLKGANLEHANLANSDFTCADLSDAKLSGTILRGTILKGAKLRTSTGLSKEQLKEAITDETTLCPTELSVAPNNQHR